MSGPWWTWVRTIRLLYAGQISGSRHTKLVRIGRHDGDLGVRRAGRNPVVRQGLGATDPVRHHRLAPIAINPEAADSGAREIRAHVFPDDLALPARTSVLGVMCSSAPWKATPVCAGH